MSWETLRRQMWEDLLGDWEGQGKMRGKPCEASTHLVEGNLLPTWCQGDT